VMTSVSFLVGEYKTILSLTSVLQNGKLAKRLADRAIDQMQGVQNLRQAIYPYKVRRSLQFFSCSIAHKLSVCFCLSSCYSVSSKPKPLRGRKRRCFIT
jgi:hypothetical protein